MWSCSEEREKIKKALKSGKPFIIVDTETTGLSAKKSFIIQISGLKMRLNEKNEFEVYQKVDCYIKPPIAVSKKIEELTGITNELLETKQEEYKLFPKIKRFLADSVLVIYNAPFDVKMISAMYERNGEKFEPFMVLDVLKMAKELVSKEESESHKLCDIASLYGTDKGLSFHNAFNDVIATYRLFLAFLNEYSEKEQEEKKTTYKKKANVLNVTFWSGYRGRSRVYVNTDKGTVYYDVYSKVWEDKDLKMEEYDMEDIRRQAFLKTGTSNEFEFARYR